MWKLTIKQERKSEHSEYPFMEKVEFRSEDLSELTMLIERISHCESACETSYKLEKAGDE